MVSDFRPTLDAIMADPVRRANVDAQVAAIEDALTLAELRRERHMTQEQIAALLGQSQRNVSRIEGQRELYLSTLAAYIEALGGHLEVRAVFDDMSVPITMPA